MEIQQTSKIWIDRTGLSEHGLWARIINCFMARMIINRILGYVLPKKSIFEVQCRLLIVKHVPFQKRLYQDYPCFCWKGGFGSVVNPHISGSIPPVISSWSYPPKKKVPRWDPKMNRSIKYDQGFAVFWCILKELTKIYSWFPAKRRMVTSNIPQ